MLAVDVRPAPKSTEASPTLRASTWISQPLQGDCTTSTIFARGNFRRDPAYFPLERIA